MKMDTVYFNLVGDALEWHHSFMEGQKNMNWNIYIYQMGMRFDRNQLGNWILSGSVDEYQRNLEKLRAQSRCSEAHALSMFLGGLKRRLQKLVATHSPHTVIEAYNLAKLYDEALLAESFQGQRTHFSDHPFPRNSTNKPGFERSQALSQKNNYTNSQSHKPQPLTKTITGAEMDEKKQKNLCY